MQWTVGGKIEREVDWREVVGVESAAFDSSACASGVGWSFRGWAEEQVIIKLRHIMVSFEAPHNFNRLVCIRAAPPPTVISYASMSRARPSVYPQPAPTESYWSALDSITNSLSHATSSVRHLPKTTNSLSSPLGDHVAAPLCHHDTAPGHVRLCTLRDCLLKQTRGPPAPRLRRVDQQS